MTAQKFLIEKGIKSNGWKIPTLEVLHWLDEYVQQYKIKADKWDKLNERIGKFYDEDNSEYFDEMGFVSIGEICASSLGYL